MKKRPATFLTIALAATATAGVLGACGSQSDNKNAGGGNGGGGTPAGFSYYKSTKLPESKKVYKLNFNESLTRKDLLAATVLQGLFARKEVTFYIDNKRTTSGVSVDQKFFEIAQQNYGVTGEDKTFAQAIEMYKNSWNDMVAAGIWGSKINLETGFKTSLGESAYTGSDGYSTPGYIVYNSGGISVNVATTLSAITGFLPVEDKDVNKYKAMGLTEKMYVGDTDSFTYKWCFDVCKSELSRDGLISQDYAKDSQPNPYMRDYGVTNKFFNVWYTDGFGSTTAGAAFQHELHEYLNKNVPIFGYVKNEDQDVALFSRYGQFLVPSDYSTNVSFHVASAFGKQKFTQKNNDKDQAAQNGKHYVAFVVSDGDNAQYWQNTAIFASSYMGAANRDNDDFAVTWSISPALADMKPLVLDTAYNGEYTKSNDYFCAPVSGQGYINAGNFYNAGKEYMDDFLGKLDLSLAKSDLGVVTIIGAENYASGGVYGTLEAYSKVNSLKGGLVLQGNKYFGTQSGGVCWKNGKPFIVPRDSLWSTTPEYISARILHYAAQTTGTDITNIDAYTVVNVHPWSHNYDDIRKICNDLKRNSNIEVVSLDRIVAMMTANVTDKPSTFAIPASGTGSSLNDAYMEAHPDMIPANAMFNDFLLWEEDWEGGAAGDIERPSPATETSAPEAYAFFKNNLRIKAGKTAKKKPFTMPAGNNAWISFYARADSTDYSSSTQFSAWLKVDGTQKTVIDSATLKGVTGTGTARVIGEGWQTFAFPIKQFFSDYAGKQAEFGIQVSGSLPLKIDRFQIADRVIEQSDSTHCPDPFSNDFIYQKNGKSVGSTEDWMLGMMFQTSEYHSWAAVNRNSLQPAGKLEVDASDGGGSEKRNGNVNCWFAKNITLAGVTGKLQISVTGGSTYGGAMSKLSMYIDGKYIVLYNWKKSKSVGGQEYNLAELSGYSAAQLEDKNVTFIFEVRDNADDTNGVEQDFYLDYFRLEKKQSAA